ncbi:adsorption protein B [Sphingorhabdus rigui]|uniref:Adsorption protein B n=1 Tax=Sphingorhabdus rigui TaxID=1282858 RepID=A0A840AXY4_9SPHN|nr:glycosyl transferase family protein [Sphingorhabdus rigui]MBB3941806.1 adsorption protein B [Sphingorhabdus rigui]
MPNWIFQIVETAQRELLMFSAVWLLIGAIDDVCVDAIWAGRRLYRKIAFYWHRPPMTVDELPTKSGPGLIAVLIPAWGEAAVIGAMLRNCSRSWADSLCDHRIYVGCYPNDPHTSAAVIRAAKHNPVIRLVLVNHIGPTTKADCLNRLWKALRADEIAGGFTTKAIVLHDAEDAVHADELRVFDRLLAIGGAVQLPVIPVRTKSSRWISGHYCDEFAEAHGKNMVVREAIGARLPLAGVACAIERNLMGRLAIMNGGDPFDAHSLTEDYELGMRIGAAGGRTIMARILDSNGRLIGTRSYFPDTLTSSVRQKTRWLTGIALAGWDRLGWNGNLAQKWMLLQDRRSILAAIVVSAAYACILLTAVLTVAETQGVHRPKPLAPMLIILLWCNAGFLFWRLCVRAGFVAALYGPKEALLSIPRSVITNIIAIMAAQRACIIYVRHCFGAPLRWDKTAHHIVPESLARPD